MTNTEREMLVTAEWLEDSPEMWRGDGMGLSKDVPHCAIQHIAWVISSNYMARFADTLVRQATGIPIYTWNDIYGREAVQAALIFTAQGERL